MILTAGQLRTIASIYNGPGAPDEIVIRGWVDGRFAQGTVAVTSPQVSVHVEPDGTVHSRPGDPDELFSWERSRWA